MPQRTRRWARRKPRPFVLLCDIIAWALVLAAVTTTYPRTLTFAVDVADPVYKTINIAATVYLRKGANAATVRAAILAALTAWFAPALADGTPNSNVDFGVNWTGAEGVVSAIAWSDLFDVVRDTAGVREVDPSAGGFTLNADRADVPLELWEFPALGVLTIINGDTGVAL